jgi:glutathione S-transferase
VAIALYHLERCPNCEKVRLALELTNQPFESHVIDPDDRSEVRRLSGQSDVPLLVDHDGKVRVESNRILRHLALDEKTRLLPESRRDQELTWVLVERADLTLAPVRKGLATGVGPEGQPLSEDDRDVLRRRLDDELGVVEGILERGPFLFGDHATVADIAVHAYLNRLPAAERERAIAGYPRVAGWYLRVLRAAGRAADTLSGNA